MQELGQTFWAVAAIAGIQFVFLIALLWLGGTLASVARKLSVRLEDALLALRKVLQNTDDVIQQIKEQQLVERTNEVLSSATGAAGRLDPLALDLQNTLSEARSLLDDATQTSQSVRARVDDLATMQSELTALTGALTDVAGELRDRELAAKLTNVLSDTSLLAADIGILAENANSYLESGKPLVSNIGGVVDSARERASGISSMLSNVRHGFRAGVESWKEGGK
jgi:hypothetical protein